MAKKEIKEEVKTKEMTKEEKRNKMILICSIAVGLVIVFVVVFCLTTRSNKSLEDELSESLTKMGEEFYTDFYYVEISKGKTATEISDNLSKFKDIGIKINLDNLSRYNDGKNKEEIAKFKNEKGTACDMTNTRAIIYPTSPYGKNDYTIKVELDCGFEQTTEAK